MVQVGEKIRNGEFYVVAYVTHIQINKLWADETNMGLLIWAITLSI